MGVVVIRARFLRVGWDGVRRGTGVVGGCDGRR